MKYTLNFNERVAMQVALVRQVRELNSLRNTWMIASRAGIRSDLRQTIAILRRFKKSFNVELETI